MITYRADKGSPLTNAEVDANFAQLANGSIEGFLQSGGTARSWIGKAGETVSILDFGGVADDAGTFTGTDNGPPLQRAITSLGSEGGRVIIPAPKSTVGYFFGTTVFLESNVEIISDAGAILYNAATSDSGNNLFQIEDVDNVIINRMRCIAKATGDFSGGRNPQKFVEMAGIVRNIYLGYLDLKDHQNFAITYGDTDTDPATAYFDNVHLNRIKIHGDCGPTGDGSGINFFPRAQSGSDPVAKNLYLSSLNIDVTRGQNAVTEHGPQCVKFQNVIGVYMSDCFLRGGSGANMDIPNGARNVHINNVHGAKSLRGFNVTCTNNVATTVTQDILMNNVSWRLDGATGSDEIGLRLGQPQRFSVTNFDFEGDIQFIHDDTAQVIRGMNIGPGILKGGIGVTNPSGAQTPMKGVNYHDITLIGGAGTGNGRLNLSVSNWETHQSIFNNITFIDHDGTALLVNGDNNVGRNLVSIDGNPDNDANVRVIVDTGDLNEWAGISILGTHNIDQFISKTAAGKMRVSRLKGSPTDTTGFNVTNQTAAWQGDVSVVSPSLDLSGSATSDLNSAIYVAQQDMYILSVQIVYDEASSADSGVAVTVGNVGSDTAYLNKTSLVDQAFGAVTAYTNDADVTVRLLAAGDTLKVKTAGGKVGDGQVKVIVTLAMGMD